MKKFLPLILCFSAFFLFSCASKPPVQSELSPEINAPSTDEEKTAPAADENNSDLDNFETSTDISTISSNEENEDLHEDLESEKENDEVQTEIIDESDIDIPNADITPAINNEENELEEIEEPQIITLEPLPEDNSENLQIQNDNQNEDNFKRKLFFIKSLLFCSVSFSSGKFENGKIRLLFIIFLCRQFVNK